MSVLKPSALTLLALSLGLSACDPSPTTPLPEPMASPSGEISPQPTASPPVSVPPAPGQSATPPPLPSAEPEPPAGSPCNTEALLTELPLPAGLTLPAGMQARLFETPFQVGQVLFSDQGQAQVFSSDRAQQTLMGTDACGGWQTLVSAELLAGINGKAAVPLKNEAGWLAAVDYWPDGGNRFGGIFRLGPEGTATQVALESNHAGAQAIVRQPRTDLLLPATLTGISVPAGLSLQVLRANYPLGPLGSHFYAPDGSLYLMTGSPNRSTLLKLDTEGRARVYARHDLLRGSIWRHGAVVNGVPVVTMDYAPAAGVETRGIYQFNADGSVTEWANGRDFAGLHDVLPAPDGRGIVFSDFENDNIWQMPDASTPAAGLLDASLGEIPGAPASLAYDTAGQRLFFLNRIEAGSWWGSGPGLRGVYQVSGGIASLLARAPEGSDWDGLAYTDKGPLGAGLYTLERQSGNLLKIAADGSSTPVVTGLPNPTELRFDPVNGNLTVVCDGQYLVQIGQNMTPLQLEDVPTADAGWYFADFENDNIWHLPAGSNRVTGLLDREVPPGLAALTYLDSTHALYALNSAGGWPFGGQAGVYEIQPGGLARLLSAAPEGSNFGGLDAGGGSFEKALYWSQPGSGQIWMGSPEQAAPRPYLGGLPQPSALKFSPTGDRLLVVVNEGRGLLWIGPDLRP